MHWFVGIGIAVLATLGISAFASSGTPAGTDDTEPSGGHGKPKKPYPYKPNPTQQNTTPGLPRPEDLIEHSAVTCGYNNPDGSPNLKAFFRDVFSGNAVNVIKKTAECWWSTVNDPLWSGLLPLGLIGHPYSEGKKADADSLATWLFWNGVDPATIGIKLVDDPTWLNKDRKSWVLPSGAPEKGMELIKWAEKKLGTDIDGE